VRLEREDVQPFLGVGERGILERAHEARRNVSALRHGCDCGCGDPFVVTPRIVSFRQGLHMAALLIFGAPQEHVRRSQ
jgi:hypothetical protein